MIIGIINIFISTALFAQSVEAEIEIINKFVKFIEWSDDKMNSSDFLSISIYSPEREHTAIINELDVLNFKNKNLRIKLISSCNELKNSHILVFLEYLSPCDTEILSYCRGENILTMSNNQNDVNNGVIIGYSISSDQLEFSVNLLEAKENNLYISHLLLKQAKNIVIK